MDEETDTPRDEVVYPLSLLGTEPGLNSGLFFQCYPHCFHFSHSADILKSILKNWFFFFLVFFFQCGPFFFNVGVYLFIYLFIYLWLCWVFVSVRGLSPVVASGVHSSSPCAGLSLPRPLLLRSTGSRRAGSVAVAHGPSCSAAFGIFPDQGSNPCPLHWQADSQPLRHQESPKIDFWFAEFWIDFRNSANEFRVLYFAPNKHKFLAFVHDGHSKCGEDMGFLQQ